MDNDTFCTELNELISQYETGLYTANELICVVIDLISESITDDNWNHCPQWIQTKIVEAIGKFSELEEIITFGHKKPEIVKQQHEILKVWLIEKGYL